MVTTYRKRKKTNCSPFLGCMAGGRSCTNRADVYTPGGVPTGTLAVTRTSRCSPELIDTSEGLKIIHDEADWASVPASTYATEVSSWITQSVRLRLSRPRTSTSDGGDSIRNEAV